MQKHDAGLLGERCQRAHADQDVLADVFSAAVFRPVEGEDADVLGVQALGHGNDLAEPFQLVLHRQADVHLADGAGHGRDLEALFIEDFLEPGNLLGFQLGDIGAPGAAHLDVAGAQRQQHGGLHCRVRIYFVAEA